MTPRSPSFIVLVAFAIAAAVGACAAKTGTVDLDRLPESTDASITVMLGRVEIVPQRPERPGYDRDCGRDHGCVFGRAWTDDNNGAGGHNGCDTRNDVLAKQLTGVVFRAGTKQCVVMSGTLRDPYTGGRIEFRKANASAVQVDHIYPLSLAWDMGADKWDPQRRIDFANDQANLLASDGPTNMSKGDKSPADWVPINTTFRCEYVKRFLTVALGYKLPIAKADADSIRITATHCT
jgi:hypothetical protein